MFFIEYVCKFLLFLLRPIAEWVIDEKELK